MKLSPTAACLQYTRQPSLPPTTSRHHLHALSVIRLIARCNPYQTHSTHKSAYKMDSLVARSTASRPSQGRGLPRSKDQLELVGYMPTAIDLKFAPPVAQVKRPRQPARTRLTTLQAQSWLAQCASGLLSCRLPRNNFSGLQIQGGIIVATIREQLRNWIT